MQPSHRHEVSPDNIPDTFPFLFIFYFFETDEKKLKCNWTKHDTQRCCFCFSFLNSNNPYLLVFVEMYMSSPITIHHSQYFKGQRIEIECGLSIKESEIKVFLL